MIFRRMKKRTAKQIILPIMLSLILSFAVALITMSHSFYTTFYNNSIRFTAQKQKTAGLFLDLIKETSMQFSFENISEEKILLNLDSLDQVNGNILGTAFFSADGGCFVSSRTSGYPSLEELKSEEKVSRFIESGGEDLWFAHIDNTASYYKNRIYDRLKGVVTYMRREAGGYLAIDIDPEAFFSIINSSVGGIFSNPIIYADGEIIKSTETSLSEDYTAAINNLNDSDNARARIPHSFSMLYRITPNSEICLFVEVSYVIVIKQIFTFLIPAFILMLILGIVTVFAAKLLLGTITHPLEKLYHTMQEEKLTELDD